MGSVMEILMRQYGQEYAAACTSLHCIAAECDEDVPILLVILKHKENLDEHIKNMVAVAMAKKEA